MKKLFISGLILFLAFGGSKSVSAQEVLISQSNTSGIYQSGDSIKISVSLREINADSLQVSINKNFGEEVTEYAIEYAGENTLVFTKTFDGAASIICGVKVAELSASIGLVVEPEMFTPGSTYPDDLDGFWATQKKQLRALEMNIKEKLLDDTEDGFYCADIEINCTGPAPARGYFAKPAEAGEKSLPIVLLVHAAGVKGSWCQSRPEEALNYAKKGALCFDLNAHGMLNGQPQAYYDALEAGELKNYAYQGMENRDQYYFLGMYLRLMRTIDFLTSQPEWDGKRLLVIGESQGGGQALAAAGLDDRVSAAVAIVPAMCDFGGPLKARKGGWPNPIGYHLGNENITEAVPYFDAAFLLKDSRATLFVEIGYIDITCPSSSIYAAINQSEGKKIIKGVPYRGHHLNQKQYQKVWEEEVYKPRMEFIERYVESKGPIAHCPLL
ncbi:acetylxylan esterase [Bacteroidota bacterium]